MSQPTCAERIAGELAGRLDDFRRILAQAANAEDEPTREEALTEAAEMPLGVELIRVIRVTLSTGGPADWFDIELDEDGYARSITYHFSDWFDHAAVPVSGPDFDVASEFLEAATGWEGLL